MKQPFITIGVTTYNRREMLKECLQSILAQTHVDFEVIVGNDFTSNKLYLDEFGIDDPRFKIVNHEENLGETQNMNWLLHAAKGKYFTWLADDDGYYPAFLESIYDALIKYSLLTCVFTSYQMSENFPEMTETKIDYGNLYEGKEFLRLYLERRIKLQGCYGVFEKDYMINTGGMIKLGTGFGPYSDNILAIRAGALEKVVYINEPLIFYRSHSGSISLMSTDLDAYSSAQKELLRESVEIFRNLQIPDFDYYLKLLLKWCVWDYYGVANRSKHVKLSKLFQYQWFIFYYSIFIGKYRYRMIASTVYGALKLVTDNFRKSVKIAFRHSI